MKYFWKQIQNIYNILPEIGSNKYTPKETIVLSQSLLSYFIICVYGLFEIIYKDFSQMEQFCNLRHKLVHGDAVFQYELRKKADLSKYQVTPLPRIVFAKGKLLFSLIWQVKKEDSSITYLINNKEKHSFIDKDGANHFFPGDAHKELEDLLKNDAVYICKSGSFICDASKLYKLCGFKVEEFTDL